MTTTTYKLRAALKDARDEIHVLYAHEPWPQETANMLARIDALLSEPDN